jgi:hypothetical protein
MTSVKQFSLTTTATTISLWRQKLAKVNSSCQINKKYRQHLSRLYYDTKVDTRIELAEVSSTRAPWWPKMKNLISCFMNNPNQQNDSGQLLRQHSIRFQGQNVHLQSPLVAKIEKAKINGLINFQANSNLAD